MTRENHNRVFYKTHKIVNKSKQNKILVELQQNTSLGGLGQNHWN